MSTQRPKAFFNRIRHPFTARHAQLIARERISPNFIRLTLGGSGLENFKSMGFDDHVKLILPHAGQQKPNLPVLIDGKPHMDEPRPVMRDYTPINYDATRHTLQLDFALHEGDGPAVQWAKTAAIGQWAGLAGPRGSGAIDPTLDWYVLIGDDTALPAIDRCLQERPFNAAITVYIQLADEADRRNWPSDPLTEVHYVHSLTELSQTLEWPEGTGFIWGAGENKQIAELREALLARGFSAQQMHLSAYWRQAS